MLTQTLVQLFRFVQYHFAAKSNLSEVNEKEDNYLMMGLKARQTRTMSFCQPCTLPLLAERLKGRKKHPSGPFIMPTSSSRDDDRDDKFAREDKRSILEALR